MRRLVFGALAALGLVVSALAMAQPERAEAAGWVGGGGPVGPPPGI